MNVIKKIITFVHRSGTIELVSSEESCFKKFISRVKSILSDDDNKGQRGAVSFPNVYFKHN